MKVRKYILFILSFFIFLSNVNAVTIENVNDIFRETAYAYYRNGDYAQYNSAKNGTYAPEDATFQDIQYSVCSRFTYNVYYDAFGIKIPNSTAGLMAYAEKSAVQANSNVLLFYSNCQDDLSPTCKTMTESEYDTFIASLRPGDVMVYRDNTNSGHALMIYDTFTNSQGKPDAYVLNSTQNPYVFSKFPSTNKISFNNKYNTIAELTNVTAGIPEGTIKMETFRGDARFNFTDIKYGKKSSTAKYKTAIIRFLEIDNGTLKTHISGSSYINLNHANASVVYETLKGKTRVDYPGLRIVKTVSSGDNNKVKLGEELTYTIKISNNNKIYNYNTYYIEESFDNLDGISIISVPEEAVIDNNVIKITGGFLGYGNSKEYNIKIKVGSESKYLGKEIKLSGKFGRDSNLVGYISTGDVINTVANSLEQSKVNAIKQNYNSYSSKYSGLKLINELYKSIDVNLDLENFKIDKVLYEDSTVLDACNTKGTATKSCTGLVKFADAPIGTNLITYKDIVLNDYWSRLINDDGTLDEEDTYFEENEVQSGSVKNLSTWSGDTSRNKTIYGSHFQDGDILIYKNSNDKLPTSAATLNSKENGIYAYIYLDGRFVGVNYPDAVDGSKRNVFTSDYYKDPLVNLSFYGNEGADADTINHAHYQTLFNKDYYVILRPALVPMLVGRDTNNTLDPIDNQQPGEENPSTGYFVSIVVLYIVLFGALIVYSRVTKKEVIKKV